MPVGDKMHLIQSAKDISIFLHAVHDRILEYRTFNETLLKLCADAKQKDGSIMVVQNVEELALAMQRKLLSQVGQFRKRLQEWDNKIADIVQQIETDNYDSASQLKHTTSLGEAQDITVADCRRYVKAIHEEVALTENTDSSTVAFATAVRQMCRQILHKC